MFAVYKKELKSYFSNMTGYIAIAMILLMAGIIVKQVSFDGHMPQMEYALPTVTIILLLAVPIVTMRSFAEEKHQRTDQLLYTLPISTTQIVLGKYFAMLTVFTLPTLILALLPPVLAMYGPVHYLASYSAILTFFFLVAAMVAICMFMSSLTESQVIAAVLGSGVLILSYFAQLLSSVIPTTEVASYIAFTVLAALVALIVYHFVKNYWVAFSVAVVLEAIVLILYLVDSSLFLGLFQKSVSKIALFDIYANTVNSQLLNLSTLVYYLSIAVLFSFLTAQAVEKRRYS